MKKQKKKGYLFVRTIGYILRIILIVMCLYSIIIGEYLWSLFSLIMVFIVFIPVILRKKFEIDLPYLFDIFICLSFIFHMDYSIYHNFDFIPFYNKFTHFFSAVVVAFIFLIIIYVFYEYHRGIKIHAEKTVFDLIMITMAFGVFWEFLEWITDYLFSWNSQTSLNDTMGDLFADTLGGIFIGIIGFFLIKRGILQSFSKDLKKLFK